MNKLLGINVYPEVEMNISFKYKEQEPQQDNTRNILGRSIGYYENEWYIAVEHVLNERNRKNELEKLKTYSKKSKTLVASVPFHSSEYLNYGIKTLVKPLNEKTWFFALDGTVNVEALVDDIYERRFPIFLKNYIPQSDETTEILFCVIMEALSQIHINFNNENIIKKLSKVTEHLSYYGKFSFLLSEGEGIFAYRSAPSLYSLETDGTLYDHLTIDNEEIEVKIKNLAKEQIVIISSNPLSCLKNENWKMLERDQIYLFNKGSNYKLKDKIYWR